MIRMQRLRVALAKAGPRSSSAPFLPALSLRVRSIVLVLVIHQPLEHALHRARGSTLFTPLRRFRSSGSAGSPSCVWTSQDSVGVVFVAGLGRLNRLFHGGLVT